LVLLFVFSFSSFVKAKFGAFVRIFIYNLWQYRLRQSSFHMHLAVIYHLLIHFSHPPSRHPFQCWRLATRHQVFVDPTLNWGNGGRYSFQIVWNYSSCPIVSGKDCSSSRAISFHICVQNTFPPFCLFWENH
jgi:hypothetical protein